MSWPLSHEFNEAIQNPQIAFNDPDLKAGSAVVGAQGLPLPRSGNFADVYQLRGADGRDWAVKCFTRPVVGLAERYALISEALALANLPFAVGFSFLAEGIRVGGAWRPIVKMEWVEGLLLNQVVRENAARPNVLAALGQMWVKLCKRLREAAITHADLQHGNVLLVPGSRPGAYGLKLIDYDGMYVPALANKPSGEAGHPSFQHPARAAARAYSPDVDRFPHLVVATALKGLATAGQSLWERYDNGDNLLFVEEDYRKPADSKLMRELWQTENPAVQALVGRLAVACGKAIPQTPWLDQLAPDGEPTPLDDKQRREAAAALGIALPVPVSAPPAPPEEMEESAAPSRARSRQAAGVLEVEAEVETDAEVDVELVDDSAPTVRRWQPKRRGSNNLMWMVAGGTLLVACCVVAGVVIAGRQKPADTAQQKPDEKKEPGTTPPPADPPQGPDNPRPKDKDPNPVVPKPKDKDLDPGMTPAKAGDPPALKVRWSTPTGSDADFGTLYLGSSNLVLIGAFRGEVAGFDLKSGAPREGFGGLGKSGAPHFFRLDNNRVAVTTTRNAEVRVVDEATAQEGEKITVPEAPTSPEGKPALLRLYISPSAKYAVAARYRLPAKGDELPLRLIDMEKKQVLATTEWTSGSVHFTADSSRVLVAEPGGRCRWFKLPSGEVGEQWTFPAPSPGRTHDVTSISGDGSILGYRGPVGRSAQGTGPAVLDGATGKVIHAFSKDYHYTSSVSLSADGRRAAVQCAVVDGVSGCDIVEARTGAPLGRVTMKTGQFIPTFAMTPDGTAVVIISNLAKKVHVLELEPAAPTKPLDPDAVPELKAKWSIEAKLDSKSPAKPHFDSDGQNVFVASVGSPCAIAAFDARTGEPVRERANIPTTFARLFPMEKGKVGYQAGDKELMVWDPATGKTTRAHQPIVPQGFTLFANLSPNGKYAAVSVYRSNPNQAVVAPLRIVDTANGKPIISTDWYVGTVAFTPDSSRALVMEGNDKFRWYDLPSGKAGDTWSYDRPVGKGSSQIAGVSADGRVILFSGAPPEKEASFHLLDGKNGAVLYSFPAKRYQGPGSALSEDGRFVTLVRNDQGNGRNVVETLDANGKLIANCKVPPGAIPAVSWKAGVVVFYDETSKKMAAYDLPAPPSP